MNITGTDPTDALLSAGASLKIVKPRSRELEPGSIQARLLYTVWKGTPITVVKSPPGGGKTTEIVKAVAYLAEHSDMKIIIATITRRAAYDIAERLGVEMRLDDEGEPRVVLAVSGMEAPADVASQHDPGNNRPVVRTIASCKMQNKPVCDLMIIDESYQATYTDIIQAADNAQQILMVGDPGQIGPVITSDVAAFRNKARGPHLSAPHVMAGMGHTEVLSMETTYRLGQETVDIIAPLYDFEFGSARPDRFLTDEDGNRVSEVVPLQVPLAATMDAQDTMLRVAQYAAGLVGVEMVEYDAGRQVRRILDQSDIAVVVAHNAQSQTLAAMLRTLNADEIVVGTADKMQGGQWAAVVALDPFVGYTTAGSHQLSTGRLCVMASRHTAHLTWVHDGGWEEALNDPDIDQSEAHLGRIVRQGLTAS